MHIGESIENLLMNIVVKTEKLLKRHRAKKMHSHTSLHGNGFNRFKFGIAQMTFQAHLVYPMSFGKIIFILSLPLSYAKTMAIQK
jgi:hypothetical protein